MISLNKLFRSKTLNEQGTRLSNIVRDNLVNSDKQCFVDFDGVSTVSSVFFQDFIFPLILEFSSEAITNRLKLINLNDGHINAYREACTKTSDYFDRINGRDSKLFVDISDINCELLILAREFSRRDPVTARIIFGLDNQLSKSIADMDIHQISKIASAGIICFEPRFTPEFATKLASMEASEIDVFLNVIGDTDIEGIVS